MLASVLTGMSWPREARSLLTPVEAGRPGSLTSLPDPWCQVGKVGSCLEGNRYLRQAGTPAAPRDTPAKPETGPV